MMTQEGNPSDHVKVHWSLSKDEIDSITGFNSAIVTDVCASLYKDCIKLHAHCIRDNEALELLFQDYSKQAKALFNTSLSCDNRKIEGLEPIYRFDFIITNEGLRLLEITQVPAPTVFMTPKEWIPYRSGIWPFDDIVILIISDEFSREKTRSGLIQYVENKSAFYLRKMVPQTTWVHVVHYDEIDHIDQIIKGRAGFYFWCESKFFETNPDILFAWSQKIYKMQWIQITDFSRFLIIGNKALHENSLLLNSKAETFLQYAPGTHVFQHIDKDLLENKNNWVLKKKLSCEGFDVFCGKYMSEAAWKNILQERLKESKTTTGYVIQEYEDPKCHYRKDQKYYIELRSFYHPAIPEADSIWYFVPHSGENKLANLSVNPNIKLARIL